jgi:hypothetical protein
LAFGVFRSPTSSRRLKLGQASDFAGSLEHLEIYRRDLSSDGLAFPGEAVGRSFSPEARMDRRYNWTALWASSEGHRLRRPEAIQRVPDELSQGLARGRFIGYWLSAIGYSFELQARMSGSL